ncbi:hypothetical protein B0A48_12152 [Cryoendolithus antarcticus]|uniref:Uncharacterized protein n=1 Tax=Cryoendolithus antarcticus TaxID=1507870 RepID=A0A1V8SUA0_9PEZI|nr:hypothetical protein B0A48_12152 [Cryoendolithus antarcticus]
MQIMTTDPVINRKVALRCVEEVVGIEDGAGLTSRRALLPGERYDDEAEFQTVSPQLTPHYTPQPYDNLDSTAYNRRISLAASHSVERLASLPTFVESLTRA